MTEFTKWSDLWGGLDSDPTLWGGTGFQEPDPPDGFDPGVGGVDTGHVALTGSLWMADDTPAEGASTFRDVVAGDAMGWAPRRLLEWSGADYDVTAFARHDEGSGSVDVDFFHSLTETSISSGFSTMAAFVYIHAELYTPANLGGGLFNGEPSFVVLSQVSPGSPLLFTAIPADRENLHSAGTAWTAPNPTDASAIRVVTLPTHGPVIVAAAPSSADPARETFYLKSLFGTGPATAAVELPIDLRPTSGLELDLTRFHVVELENGLLNFYYRVIDSQGNSRLAFLSYLVEHETFDPDIPFNASGVIVPPTVILSGLKPVVAHKGARRHPVTNEVVLALELDNTPDSHIHWYATRGGSARLDPVPMKWDSIDHPNLYGGLLLQRCPDREIKLISVGWSGRTVGSSFSVLAGLAMKLPAATDSEFGHTYQPTLANNGDRDRTLIGLVTAVRNTEEAATTGEFRLIDGGVTPLLNDERKRLGYPIVIDPFTALSLVRMDASVVSGVVPAEVGAAGEATNTVTSAPGIIKSGYAFTQTTSRIDLGGDPTAQDWRTDQWTFSLWFYPQSGTSDVLRAIVGLDGASAMAFLLSWNSTAKQFQLQVGTSGGILSTLSAAGFPEDVWYHITCRFDHANPSSIYLYLFGVLVAKQTAGGLVDMDHNVSALPIVLGDFETYLGGAEAALCRMDDFVFSGTDVPHKDILLVYHLALVGTDAPVRVSRNRSEPKLSDYVAACACTELVSGTGQWCFVNLRKVSMSHGLGAGDPDQLRHGACLDVWIEENSNTPSYIGTLPLPDEYHDAVTAISGTGVELPGIEFDHAVRLELLDNGDGTLTAVGLVHANASGGVTHSSIFAITFNPSDLFLNPVAEIVATLQATGAGQLINTFTAVRTTEDGPYVFIASEGTGGGGENEYRILPRASWGGELKATTGSLISSILPGVSVDDNFRGITYSTAFGSALDVIRILGVVGRELSDGTGHPLSTRENGGKFNLQFIYALGSEGGGFVPANSPNVVASTLSAIFRRDLVDALTPSPIISPRQLDEYGFRGRDPFIPYRWIEVPNQPTSATFLLALSGTRAYDDPTRMGRGDLSLLQLAREGTWGVRELFTLPTTWTGSFQEHPGADACLTFDSNPTSPNPWLFHLLRPAVDRSDKFSTLYISKAEGVLGGWELPVSVDNGLALRRSDTPGMPVWLDVAIETRTLSNLSTGPRVLKGEQTEAQITLRWCQPGSINIPSSPPP